MSMCCQSITLHGLEIRAVALKNTKSWLVQANNWTSLIHITDPLQGESTCWHHRWPLKQKAFFCYDIFDIRVILTRCSQMNYLELTFDFYVNHVLWTINIWLFPTPSIRSLLCALYLYYIVILKTGVKFLWYKLSPSGATCYWSTHDVWSNCSHIWNIIAGSLSCNK